MMANRPGELTDPDMWRVALRPDLMAALTAWVAGQAFDVTHRRWLNGASGAVVAVILIQRHAGSTHGAILKLLPPDIAEVESRGVALAHDCSPPGFRKHLVMTTSAGQLGGTGWYVHLQEVAQLGMARLVQFGELTEDPAFADYAAVVANAVVTDWKRDMPGRTPTRAPADFLNESLGRHLSPGGTLRRFAERVGLDIDRPAPTVRIPSRGVMPNPLALVRGTIGSGIGNVVIFRGNGHGDLHLGNVLLPITQDVAANDFLLVDLGRFSPDTPVARDPTKLLLSVAQARLPSIARDLACRSNLVEQTVAPWAFSAAPQLAGYRKISESIHLACHRWATAHRLSHEWTSHSALVLVDAALRTVGRDGQPDADAWWYLELAAVATSYLLDPGSIPGAPPLTEPASPVVPRQRSGKYSADVKLQFVIRLGESWSLLATAVSVEPYAQAQWARGHEAERIWAWLEERGRLRELHSALTRIGREDLARLFESEPTEHVEANRRTEAP